MIPHFITHIFLGSFTVMASLFNVAFDTPHEPESRPNFAEVCWDFYEDNSVNIWLEFNSQTVCDGNGKVGYFSYVPNTLDDGWSEK
jgi:hypothetical protein